MSSPFRTENLFIQRFCRQFLQIGQLLEILIHSKILGTIERFLDSATLHVFRADVLYWEAETPGDLMQSSASTLTLPIEPFLADFGFSLASQCKTLRLSYET